MSQLDQLRAAIAGFVNSVKEFVTHSPSLPVILDQTDLAAGASKTYDLAAAMGGTVSPDGKPYVMPSALVSVRAKDVVTDSPTKGHYVTAEASVGSAISEDGLVTITNHSDSDLSLIVAIYAPSLELPL